MLRVLFDTNFLLLPGQSKIDVFTEVERILKDDYEIVIINEINKEINKLAEGRTKDKQAAKVALALIKQKNLKTLENSLINKGKYADDIIVSLVDRDTIVCTLDKELKRRIREKGGKIITLKGYNKIALE